MHHMMQLVPFGRNFEQLLLQLELPLIDAFKRLDSRRSAIQRGGYAGTDVGRIVAREEARGPQIQMVTRRIGRPISMKIVVSRKKTIGHESGHPATSIARAGCITVMASKGASGANGGSAG